MASLEELEKRIQVLEDVEAIKRLKAFYAKACDDKYNPSLMKEVFTEDQIRRANEIIPDELFEHFGWER